MEQCPYQELLNKLKLSTIEGRWQGGRKVSLQSPE